MKFEEQELREYEKARKELSLLQYYFAIASILLFIDDFQIIDKDINFIPVIAALLLSIAIRVFFFKPDKMIFGLVEKAISQDEESITNLAKVRKKLQ